MKPNRRDMGMCMDLTSHQAQTGPQLFHMLHSTPMETHPNSMPCAPSTNHPSTRARQPHDMTATGMQRWMSFDAQHQQQSSVKKATSHTVHENQQALYSSNAISVMPAESTSTNPQTVPHPHRLIDPTPTTCIPTWQQSPTDKGCSTHPYCAFEQDQRPASHRHYQVAILVHFISLYCHVFQALISHHSL